MMVLSRVDESTIGETPLIELDLDVPPTVYAKVEWFNLHDLGYGGGSIKSRIVPRMLDSAEAAGDLPGRTIIEASSGNTASELARVGGARGYDVEIVMPADAATGKIEATRDAGAEIHFVPAGTGYEEKFGRIGELLDAHEGSYFWINQYDSPANPAAHYATTGPELWQQSNGELTHFIAGVGTGGTITGTGRALHERGDVTVIGFEPNEEPHAIHGLRYFRGKAYAHRDAYDESVLDSRRYLDSETAWEVTRELRDRYADQEIEIVDTGQYDESLVREKLRVDGEFVVGPSSGAAIAILRRLIGEWSLDSDDTVGLLLADRGDKYSESLWDDL